MWLGRPFLVVLILLGALPLPRSALSVLHADPPTPRTDLYGDPLPPGAVARLGTVRFRVNGPVRAVALSPDGKTAAALGVEMGTNWRMNALYLWEGATGRLLHRCPAHANSGWALAFSADGSLLATVDGDNEVWLWDVATGKVLRQCMGHVGDPFFYVCFSPQGKRLAAAGSHVVCTWDQESGKLLSRSEPEEEQLGVAFSPDGKALARVEVDHAALLWQAAGERLRPDAISCLTISSDGKTVACADQDGVVWLWEAETGKPIRQDKRTETAIRALAFSADGKVLAIGNGARVDVVEVGGKKIATCRGHSQEVTSLSFSGDGKRLLSGSEDGTVRIWEAHSGKPLGPWEGHGGNVRAIAFHPDGRTLASGGMDGTVRLWDVGGRLLCERGEHGGPITTLSFAPDGKRLASTGGNAGEVRVWEVTAGRQLRPAWMHACAGMEAAFSPDGETVVAATAGPAGEIQLWDAHSGKEQRRWPAHRGGCSGLSYAPNGKTLASVGADRTLRFWEPATGRQLQAQPLTGQPLFHHIGSCPDRGWACVETPPFIDLWDEAGSKRLRRLFGGVAFSWSPDGWLLATAQQGRLKLVEVATGKEVLDWPSPQDTEVRAVAFAPDGRRLVSAGGDSTLVVWDVDLLLSGGRPTPAAPTDEELASLWRALASTDAAQAYRAISALAAAPARAVPFLRQRLRPIKRDRQRNERLLAELDSDSYAVRNRAYQQLEALGEAAETELRQALAASPNLEVRLRVERLLALATSSLRPLRALAVLERVGTPEARQVLQQLAEGAEGARLTRAARSALRRMDKRGPARGPE